MMFNHQAQLQDEGNEKSLCIQERKKIVRLKRRIMKILINKKSHQIDKVNKI